MKGKFSKSVCVTLLALAMVASLVTAVTASGTETTPPVVWMVTSERPVSEIAVDATRVYATTGDYYDSATGVLIGHSGHFGGSAVVEFGSVLYSCTVGAIVNSHEYAYSGQIP